MLGGWAGSAHWGAACRGRLRDGNGLRLNVRPWPTLGCVVLAGVRLWALQGGNTALLWAVWKGKVEAVVMLLDRGADLETKGSVSPTLRD